MESKSKAEASTAARGCGCLFLGFAVLWIIGVSTGPKSSSVAQTTGTPMPPQQKPETATNSSVQAVKPQPEKAKPAVKSPASSGPIIQGQNWFGASSKETFEKLVNFAIQKDEVAFKKAMGRELVQGDATFFKDGEKIIVTETAIFSGLVRIRRPGEETEFWTNLEAIKN